ncbi:MAG: hypothetical protein H0X66_11335 [Verrucomicrobia bacterium]|nr:hypothetical protein [Verrucomicrobiota bacterium]
MIKGLNIWLPAYLRQKRWSASPGKVTDILLSVCDHFEPFHHADKKTAMVRLANWKERWPELIGDFTDSDGIRPRHSFFYPIEQYDPDVLNEISEICRLSGGEVEVHLHHKDDTAETLREKLKQGIADFRRHNLLSSDEQGNVRYGFIHGNWCLDNSHPFKRNCGVSSELGVLRQTGCYGDFTMPSAPHPTQTRTINSLYYGVDTPEPKSHDTGIPVSARQTTRDLRNKKNHLLLVQGPLGLNWSRRKMGILPKIENADLTAANPPRPDRMRLWVRSGIRVQQQPDWLFIKLHTHGAISPNSDTILGEPMKRFHQHLMDTYKNEQFRIHYVTAREMVNILHAAEDGKGGNPGKYRDYCYKLFSQR